MGNSRDAHLPVKGAAPGVHAAALAVATALVVLAGVAGAGLRTGFVEVNMGCLKPGERYSLLENRNIPLSVTNTGKAPVALAVEVLRPGPRELRDGYGPIPDESWISFEQSRFDEVEPGTNAITDVVVRVPEDDRYLGRHYQAWLYSHTMNRGGVRVGLKSRLLFSICKE